ncbi:MAG: OmpH family outer membrane protein [Saprospiraceae bacterium]|mgnify:CR=1 FL=1|jgi:outer membrane protein|nr:outer membrane chaperone Skp [Saprospirales bacterium]RME10591.1 MAG: OmpH family outer membrane protein [Bacteroidota bacterium]
MKKLILKFSIFSAVMLLTASALQAQKFGYVNSAAILSTLPEVEQMRSTLEAFETQLKKQGEAKVQAYQKKEQDALQKKQRGEMTPREEEQVTKDLQAEQEAIYKFGQEMEQKIMAKQQELMEPILKKVNDAIKAVAEENGYQFIFDAQSGVILYADETADVTDLVKAKLEM